MFDDLAALYHENVVSAFVDYRDISESGIAGRSRDLRGALIASEALFHFREHLPKAGALTRAEVEKLCPDYGLLGDVVNAAKHKSITNKTPQGPPLVDDATQLGEQIVITEYRDDVGIYRHAQKIVIAKLSDGSERNLLEVLTNVINFWEEYLHSVGVLSTPRTFAYAGNIQARSRAECEANRLDFEIIQGQRFSQSLLLRRFNPKTGKAEPIDLSGSKLNFRIYRHQYHIDLSLTHEASGKEFKKTITLSEGESERIARLSNDAERQAYINGLPEAQNALRQLAVEAGLVQKSTRMSDS